MQATKVQFSPDEMRLMADSSWILTKNAVIAKIYEGMGNLAVRMKDAVETQQALLPDEILLSNAKISRGENFRSLPYVMLDYPRLFGKEDILAIRTFFWWGNFCSISLHVKGSYKAAIVQNANAAAKILSDNHFYYSAGGDEWNHDITSDDYAPVSMADGWQLPEGPFIKLSAKMNLIQWSEMEEDLYALFVVLLKLSAFSL